MKPGNDRILRSMSVTSPRAPLSIGEPSLDNEQAQRREENGALARAATLRFPDLSALRGRERVEALIDHITATAILRGDLEELRLEAQVKWRDAKLRFDGLPQAGSTKARTDDARRRAAPDLAAEVDSARWVIARCTEQIDRLGGTEYDAASRIYTMLGA